MKYHIDLGIPAPILTRLSGGTLRAHDLSYHAVDRCREKGIDASLWDGLAWWASDVVEVTCDEAGLPYKCLVRVPYNDTHDVCLAVVLSNRRILTCYLNAKNDLHNTLNRQAYAA